jgi:mxaA protein
MDSMPMPSPRTSTAEAPRQGAEAGITDACPRQGSCGTAARAAAAALACALAATAPAAADEPEPLRVHVADPRAYGYQVGDTALRRITLDVPRRLRLDEASLPQVGRVNGALELRALTREARDGPSGTRLTLGLEYQVFAAPSAVRVFELPPLRLRFDGTPREEELRVDAWPLAVAPLGPEPVAHRAGLGELRPDTPPPPLDARWERRVLAGCAVLAVPLLGYLAWVYGALPWWTAARRPFGRAYRALRRQGAAAPSPDDWREACRALHAAFNETAGRVVFADGVDRFVEQAPRFATLREDIRAFFERSQAGFFGGADPRPPGDAAAERRWLLGFARACRDAERGS